MDNRQPSSFKIGMDEEGSAYSRASSQNFPKNRKDSRRLDKISRRVTLLAVVLPCLLAGVLYWGFREIDTRFEAMQISGFSEVETLSRDLEARLGAISEKYAALEKSMDEQDEPMNEAFLVFERTTASLREGLEEIRNQIEALDAKTVDRAAIEADKQELSQQIARLSESLTPVRESVQEAQTRIEALEAQYSADLANLMTVMETAIQESETVRAELARMKKDLVDVLSTTIDKKALEAAIKNQADRYQGEIGYLTQNFAQNERAITTLQNRIRDLERQVDTLNRRRNLGTPRPGTILEEDIQ